MSVISFTGEYPNSIVVGVSWVGYTSTSHPKCFNKGNPFDKLTPGVKVLGGQGNHAQKM